jgi:hypothetical protein
MNPTCRASDFLNRFAAQRPVIYLQGTAYKILFPLQGFLADLKISEIRSHQGDTGEIFFRLN